jgi:hypothetical protein
VPSSQPQPAWPSFPPLISWLQNHSSLCSRLQALHQHKPDNVLLSSPKSPAPCLPWSAHALIKWSSHSVLCRNLFFAITSEPMLPTFHQQLLSSFPQPCPNKLIYWKTSSKHIISNTTAKLYQAQRAFQYNAYSVCVQDHNARVTDYIYQRWPQYHWHNYPYPPIKKHNLIVFHWNLAILWVTHNQ